MRPDNFRAPVWLQSELDLLHNTKRGKHGGILAFDVSNVVYREAFANQAALLPGEDGNNDDYLMELVIRMIDDNVKITSSKHVALAFDSPVPSYRVDLMDGQYKKEKVDKYPHVRECAKRVLTRLRTELPNAVTFEAAGYEADDMLYCLAATEHVGGQVIVVSSDEDLCQVLRYNNTLIYNPGSKKFITADGFEKENGYRIPYLPLRKAIVGDPSDNISGIKGVGKVTFRRWMNGSDLPVLKDHLVEIANTLDIIYLPGMDSAKPFLSQLPDSWPEWEVQVGIEDDFDELIPF